MSKHIVPMNFLLNQANGIQTTATWTTANNCHLDNCHPRGVVGREHISTLF